MKSQVADPETRVFCMRIETIGGLIFRFTWYPHDLLMTNGTVYKADPYFEPTGISSTSTMSPDVFDVESFFSTAGITRDQLISGVLDSAKVYLFATSWASSVEDYEPLKKGVFGKGRIEDDRFTIEMMGLVDALGQNVGRSVGPKCDWTLFDETLDGETIPYNRSRCTGPRSAQDGPLLADYKVSGTVTSVTSKKVWQDSGRTEAANYFQYGSILWKTGNNAGLRSFEIKASLADGTITTHLAAHYAIEVGDTYEMIPGCDHTRPGDCVGKYSNAINFGGFADVITTQEYGKVGGQ